MSRRQIATLVAIQRVLFLTAFAFLDLGGSVIKLSLDVCGWPGVPVSLCSCHGPDACSDSSGRWMPVQ